MHFYRHCHYLNSILYIKHFKVRILLSFVRSPEPQQPQPIATDDIIRSNNNDPDEDEDYYRKQLSYFDRRSFDSKPSAQLAPAIMPTQPQTQPGYYPRYVFQYLIILNATQFNVLFHQVLIKCVYMHLGKGLSLIKLYFFSPCLDLYYIFRWQ